MTATPTVHVFVAGEVATAANINLFGTAINFLKQPPIVEMNQTVGQSYATASAPTVGLTFTTEVVDSSGMHSTSVNTSRCTCVYPGWYEAAGGVSFVANVTGSRGTAWAVTGTVLNGTYSWLPANTSGLQATPARTKKFFMNAGTDYCELWAAQTSGGALLTSVGASDQPNFSLRWISD